MNRDRMIKYALLMIEKYENNTKDMPLNEQRDIENYKDDLYNKRLTDYELESVVSVFENCLSR